MEAGQNFWITAKNFFSMTPKKPLTNVVITERKELPVLMSVEMVRHLNSSPMKTANADEMYLYEFGSLNMP